MIDKYISVRSYDKISLWLLLFIYLFIIIIILNGKPVAFKLFEYIPIFYDRN